MSTIPGTAFVTEDLGDLLGGIGTASPGPMFLVDDQGATHPLNELAEALNEADGVAEAYVSPVRLGAERTGRLVGYVLPGADEDAAPLVSALVALAAGVLSRRLAEPEPPAPAGPREVGEAVLDDACRRLPALLDERAVAHVTANAARRAFGARAAAVLLPSSDGTLVVAAADGVGSAAVRRVRPGRGLLGRAALRGEPLAAENPWRLASLAEPHDAGERCVLDSWMEMPLVALPLACGPQLAGLLVVSGLPVVSGRPSAALATERLGRLADRAAASLAGARMLGQVRRQERLAREMEIARQIQSSLLLDTSADVAGLDVAAECRSASAIGGDYVGFRPSAPDELTATIFDVAGHGIGAAFCMTLVRATLQGELARGDGLDDALGRANRLVFDDVAASGLFATAFVARFDRRAGVLRYASAGHQMPIHWSVRRRAFVPHPEGGLPLGLLEDGRPPEAATDFGEGDVFLAYTDGVVEATNAQGEPFGRHRLLGLVHRGRRLRARALLKRIWRELEAFLDGAPLSDDATIAVVRGRPGCGAAHPRRPTPLRAGHAHAPLAPAPRPAPEPDDAEREDAPAGVSSEPDSTR